MNVRKIVVTGAIAAILATMPSAAFAYGADDYSDRGSLSVTFPSTNDPFRLAVAGPAGATVVLTMTGPNGFIRTMTGILTSAGTFTFDITVADPGIYTFVVIDAQSGALLSSQTAEVLGAQVLADDPTQPATGQTAATQLAATGVQMAPYTVGALAAVVIGAGAVAVSRRRQEG